jgi:serine/threonine-protein kinase HipA
MRKAKILMKEKFAGYLTETDEGYLFEYSDEYINDKSAEAVSLTLPLSAKSFKSNTMFPFFDGLIPEGWLLEVAQKNWKLNQRDRMGLLMVCCKDCIGAVAVIGEE